MTILAEEQSAAALIRDCVGIFATLAATIMAGYGVLTWRKEHIGKRKLDLVEDVLVAFAKFEASLKAARFNFKLRYRDKNAQ